MSRLEERIAAAYSRFMEICERNQDTPTANILQDLLDATEKPIWFLFEAAQGGRRAE